MSRMNKGENGERKSEWIKKRKREKHTQEGPKSHRSQASGTWQVQFRLPLDLIDLKDFNFPEDFRRRRAADLVLRGEGGAVAPLLCIIYQVVAGGRFGVTQAPPATKR